jgi:hypothetical protein
LKNFSGGHKNLTFLLHICDNNRDYQNQLQNLIKNIEKSSKFCKNHKNFTVFPQILQFSKKIWQEQL